MAHFYASIQGNRGEATRMGTKSSGIDGHIRGWTSGVKVYGHYDETHDFDHFDIYLSSGSNGHYSDEFIGSFRRIDGVVQKYDKNTGAYKTID